MKGRFRQIEKDIAELKALKTDIQELKWLIEAFGTALSFGGKRKKALPVVPRMETKKNSVRISVCDNLEISLYYLRQISNHYLFEIKDNVHRLETKSQIDS